MIIKLTSKININIGNLKTIDYLLINSIGSHESSFRIKTKTGYSDYLYFNINTPNVESNVETKIYF